MANQYMQPWFDQLSQGVAVANSLRQAALQQQQLDQAKAQFQSEMDLRNREFGMQQQMERASLIGQGAKPVDASGNTQEPMPQPNSLPMLPGQPVTDPNAQGTTNVPADAGRDITVGGSTLQVPTLVDKMNNEIAQQKAIEQQTMPTAGQIFGDELPPGADPNVPVPNAGQVLAGRAYGVGLRAQQQTGPKLVAHQITADDQGNQTLVRTYDDGSVQETPLKAKGRSDKFGNPEVAAATTSARALTENQRQESANKALTDYQKSSKEESELQQESLALGTALKTGQHYVDKNGNLKKFDPAVTDEEKAAQLEDMRNRLGVVQNRLQQVVADKNGAMNRYADLSGNNNARPQVSTAAAQAGYRAGVGTQQPKALLPPKAAQQLKRGIVTTFRNGQRWTLDANGQPAQVQSQGN